MLTLCKAPTKPWQEDADIWEYEALRLQPQDSMQGYVCKKGGKMQNENKRPITVQATVNTPIENAWSLWTEPQHITQWCAASTDWHAPLAENDLRNGGKFKTRMEAKDGSFGFDFEGVYNQVNLHDSITYTMPDGRKVDISFLQTAQGTTVTETFEPEDTNPLEMQEQGWQAILDNFKKYAEEKGQGY